MAKKLGGGAARKIDERVEEGIHLGDDVAKSLPAIKTPSTVIKNTRKPTRPPRRPAHKRDMTITGDGKKVATQSYPLASTALEQKATGFPKGPL